MKIKICGLTSLQDAIGAIEAGADLLGFNFYRGSQRYLEPARCAEITADPLVSRGEVLKVGVFVDATALEIEDVMRECGLDLAQLHGDETPATLETLAGRAFKAIRPRTAREVERAVRRYGKTAPRTGPALLVDAHRPGRYGGTGELADWGLAGKVAAQEPILLAGGLTPENVRSALTRVRPWGVDVASGVEVAPGKKDREKMELFVRAARSWQREVVTG